ncbi:MAG: HAD family phosphatase [Patescibacteria group bacterium]
MNNVFLFDLDGVLIDDESIWEKAKETIYLDLFGKEMITKMGSTVGINMDGIYELATKNGSTIPKETLLNAFYDRANEIYTTAPIPDGLDELVHVLKSYGFLLGIVSASPKAWIDLVVERLSFKEDLSLILSLFDRPDLLHKPAPDGYNEAIRTLQSNPQNTLVLEDSNAGIAAAKAAGAYTIGLKQNLVAGYVQKGADKYVDTIGGVIEIVKKFKPL